MNKKDCIITDLEGTLSNCEHRINYYKNKNYNKWNELFKEDAVNESMVEIINRYKVNGIKIIMCSAKSNKYFHDTVHWLQKNKLLQFFDEFYFREESDLRSSVAIKKGMLKMITKKYNVLVAYDDRKDICHMYYNKGITPYLFIADKHKTPADFLEEAAEVFRNKNKEYGDSYKSFGKIMMAYFPNGVELKTKQDFTRYAILNIMIAKTDRYCKNFIGGGHEDSLTDLSIYSTMLKEIDNDNNI